MKKIVTGLLFLISGVFLAFNSTLFFSLLIEDFNLSWVLSDALSRIVEVSFLSMGLFLILSGFIKNFKSLKITSSLLIGFGISFAFNPIYIDDYGISQSDNKSLDFKLIETHFPNLLTNNESVVVSFFTSTCPFCKSTAINFELNKRAGKQPKTIILFPSTKEDAESFLKQTNTKFDYSLITDKEFLDNAGNRFPSVFLIKNGKVENHWIGSEINYSVLDYLRELAD